MAICKEHTKKFVIDLTENIAIRQFANPQYAGLSGNFFNLVMFGILQEAVDHPLVMRKR